MARTGTSIVVSLANRKPWRMRVRSIEGTRIELEGCGHRGPIVKTGVPLEVLVARLRPGDEVRALVHRSMEPGVAEFTTEHLDECFRPRAEPAPAAPAAPAGTAGGPPDIVTTPQPVHAIPQPADTGAAPTSEPEVPAPNPTPTPVIASSGACPSGPPAKSSPPGLSRPAIAPTLHATVVRIDGPHDIVVLAAGTEGRLVGPAAVLEGHARALKPGQPLPSRVRRARPGPDGMAQFELVARPARGSAGADAEARQAWRQVVHRWACKPGDVVRGCVVALHGEEGVEIEIYPGVVLLVPLDRVDAHPVKARQLQHLMPVGHLLRLQVTRLDADTCSGEATLCYVPVAERAGFPLRGSKSCFLHDEHSTRRLEASEARERADAHDWLRREKQEQERAHARRLRLQRQAERRDEEASEARRQREREVRARVLASPAAFLEAMRGAYEAMLTLDDRKEFPLAEVRIGHAFLASAGRLQGVSLDKVLQVSAEVACECAREVEGREVHRLRSGPAGNAPPRIRTRDGAVAWRCALQVKTPGARRLHWWEVPSSAGRIIELAWVGHHDDMTIPE